MKIIYKSYITELKPTNIQKSYLVKCVNTARKTYNWGLDYRIKLYDSEHSYVSFYDQCKILTQLKKTEFKWMIEVTKFAPEEALRDLNSAYVNFFNGAGFPKFKKKGQCKESFTIRNPEIYSNVVHIPKLGPIKLQRKDFIPYRASILKHLSATFNHNLIRDRWYVSVNCEIQIEDTPKPGTVLGLDVGLSKLVTCSNGSIFNNNKYLSEMERRIARASRVVNRRKLNSKNRLKARTHLRRLHSKVSNQRSDSIHKMTKILVTTKPRYLVVENLNVSGMVKNHRLAKSIYDASWSEIKRQLYYKTNWYGGEVIEADRFYPSTKTCSNCNHKVDEMPLSMRTFTCPKCGFRIDRDLNAAINLEHLGRNTLGLRGINALGESVSRLQSNVDAVSMNKEISCTGS